MVKGMEVIDQFINELRDNFLQHALQLKQMKRDHGFNAFYDKVRSGEISRDDAALKLIDYSDAYTTERINRDAEVRKQKLIKQIGDKVGNIIECELKRNANRGLDGYVYGDKDQVRVETIIAGGHNIQRMHFRTILTPTMPLDLVNKLNEIKGGK